MTMRTETWMAVFETPEGKQVICGSFNPENCFRDEAAATACGNDPHTGTILRGCRFIGAKLVHRDDYKA